jgi:predicted nucleic acid-binding protein
MVGTVLGVTICTTVLSEDLQDGMDFGGVRVVNPF